LKSRLGGGLRAAVKPACAGSGAASASQSAQAAGGAELRGRRPPRRGF